jgi:hypothetical protein
MCANRDTFLKEKGLEEVVAELMIGGSKVIISYSNQQCIVSDIEFLKILFAERVSTNKKYTSKSLQQVKDITDRLIEKYGIDTTVNDPMASLDTDLITVPRIVACFPGKICEYYHRGYGVALVTFYGLSITKPAKLSRAILCPHFTALNPREVMSVQTSMQIVSFLVHVIVNEVLHKKLGNYAPLDNIFTYYAAEHHSWHSTRVKGCIPHSQ